MDDNQRIDSNSSEEVIYVSDSSDKDDRYGVNLLENHESDNEIEILDEIRPNTDHDSLLAEQLQAQFNTSDNDETSSISEAIRLQVQKNTNKCFT